MVAVDIENRKHEQLTNDKDITWQAQAEMPAAVLLLVSAVAVPANVVCAFSQRKELEFENEFDHLSIEIATSFVGHLNIDFRAVSGISIAISNLLQVTERSKLDFSIPNLGPLSQRFPVTGASGKITWSPLIRNDLRRQQLNHYVLGSFPPKTQYIKEYTPSDASDLSRKLNSIFRSSLYSSPVWQIVPGDANAKAIHYDQMLDCFRRQALEQLIDDKQAIISATVSPFGGLFDHLERSQSTGPRAVMYQPVFDSLQMGNLIGSIALEIDWETLLCDILHFRAEELIIILESRSGQAFTFQSASGTVKFVGEGDFHDTKLGGRTHQSSRVLSQSFGSSGAQVLSSEWDLESSPYRVQTFPTKPFTNPRSYPPKAYSITLELTPATLALLLISFVMWKRRWSSLLKYLLPVQRRVRLPGSLILRSVFVNPERRQDRFPLKRGGSCPMMINCTQAQFPVCLEPPKIQLKSYLSNPPSRSAPITAAGEPIADLFPHTTILHADISGFTAWSSEREPPQLFLLLETVYSAFDKIANKLGVYKVETIGDCYVAATGLLEPQRDHAVIMVEFARECINRLTELTTALEASLGPSTSHLALRIGIDSGPVTAGILRGDRSRLQLFGEAMNNASRLESTSRDNMIHASQATHDLLVVAGKSSWLKSREDLVAAKGKGRMQTYWVKTELTQRAASKVHRNSLGHLRQESETHCVARQSNMEGWGDSQVDSVFDAKAVGGSDLPDRLVDWNADLLSGLLQNIVTRRSSLVPCPKVRHGSFRGAHVTSDEIADQLALPCIPLEEISESLTMPHFCHATAAADIVNLDCLELDENVRNQLWDFVAQIASMYRENAFHNFEHASHVAMSARKLLKRIIKPDGIDYGQEYRTEQHRNVALGEEIHNCSLGISSDPWMQFAVVFAALVHDVDHTGVTNTQLIEEGNPIATTYKGQCIAEQHSIHVAWKLLMQDQFADLRACIYANDAERDRFRKLVVNAVIATDIADKQLQTWRKNRWDKAFHRVQDEDVETLTTLPQEHLMNYKATIVFEYIIQASDVAHTMQHWKVYIKWNERLFLERSAAYRARRASEDPATRWFKDEIWFFDNYIIPLANKLKECGVFGVSSDEYLNYALANRREWEAKGEEIVSGWVLKAQRRNSMRTVQQRRRSVTANSA